MIMTNIYKTVLKHIAKRIVRQSESHKNNIIEYYRIIQDATINEFPEDNAPTTQELLKECFQESLKQAPNLPKAPVSDHSAKLSRQYDKLVKNMDKAHGLYEPCPLCHQPRVYNATHHTIVCIPCNGSRNATDQEIIDYAKRETIRKDLMEKEILEKQKIVDNIDLHAVVKKYFF